MDGKRAEPQLDMASALQQLQMITPDERSRARCNFSFFKTRKARTVQQRHILQQRVQDVLLLYDLHSKRSKQTMGGCVAMGW